MKRGVVSKQGTMNRVQNRLVDEQLEHIYI